MKVLIIDSDKNAALNVAAVMSVDDQVVIAKSARDAITQLESNEFDLVTSECVSCDRDGPAFIRQLHAASRAPIIVISSMSDLKMITSALYAGADDYVQKPFNPLELRARIAAVRRRHDETSGNKTENHVVRFGDYQFDIPALALYKGNERVVMTGTISRILKCLAIHRGLTVTRQMLGDEVFGGNVPADMTLGVHMTKLRKKIAPAEEGKSFIETVWGRGYRLLPEGDNPVSYLNAGNGSGARKAVRAETAIKAPV